MNNNCYLGIDCGGTKIAAAVFSQFGKIITDKTVFLEGTGGADAADLLCSLIKEYDDFCRHSDLNLMSTGICIPGIVYHDSGKVWAPNIPGWDHYQLLDDIQKILPDIPVHLDSDRACYILGETWTGAAKGCHNAIFVAVGTGIGIGILADDRILRGHGDIAGATGWMALKPPYNKKYNDCGCFEYYASGDGIARTALEIISEMPEYTGVLKGTDIKAYDVFTAYKENDPVAKKTFKIVIELWGMAVANYVSLFNPQMIIFGGGVFGPAIQF